MKPMSLQNVGMIGNATHTSNADDLGGVVRVLTP